MFPNGTLLSFGPDFDPTATSKHCISGSKEADPADSFNA